MYRRHLKWLEKFHQKCIFKTIRWKTCTPDNEVLARADSSSIKAKIICSQMRWSPHAWAIWNFLKLMLFLRANRNEWKRSVKAGYNLLEMKRFDNAQLKRILRKRTIGGVSGNLKCETCDHALLSRAGYVNHVYSHANAISGTLPTHKISRALANSAKKIKWKTLYFKVIWFPDQPIVFNI